jgi:ParB-like chromosome segregation protein Spo0J
MTPAEVLAVKAAVRERDDHRRLEAIRRLQWKEVEVDVVTLSDEDMSLQALVENLQREGLNDADKADGVAAYIKLRMESSKEPSRLGKIEDELSSILGFSRQRIQQFREIAGFGEEIKEEIRAGRIKGETAAEAHRLGGEEAVKTAAEKGLPRRTLREIGDRLDEIEDEKVKEKVREQVIKGKVTDPDDVVKEARRMGAGKKKKAAPPDLLIVISQWTGQIEEWTAQLDEVVPYIQYIDTQPKVAQHFREAIGGLIERLQKFL